MIVKDIKKCFLLYGTTPSDYFLFGFDNENISYKSRSSFVTDTLKDYALSRYDGWEKYLELSDKFKIYQRVPEFFGRKVLLVNKETSCKVFRNFVNSVGDLFIKPLSGSYGKGAFVFSAKDEKNIIGLYNKLTKNETESWIVEERIIQDKRMAEWNASSVNTVRFTSILTPQGYHVLTPVLRTGRSGNIVDNGGSGGILSNIDINTGIIYTDGLDEHGCKYISHPDSSIKYKGFQIPKWDELLVVAKQLHEVLYDHKYVGWDFALSENGWVLIEGNWGQFLCQYVDKVGRKKEFINHLTNE